MIELKNQKKVLKKKDTMNWSLMSWNLRVGLLGETLPDALVESIGRR